MTKVALRTLPLLPLRNTDRLPQPRGQRASSLFAAAFCIVLAVSSCSDGGPSEDARYSGALTDIQKAVQQDVDRWAGDVALTLKEQLETTGKIDLASAQTDADRTGGPLAASICQSIMDNDDAANTVEHAREAAKELDIFVDRELMVAIGKYPSLIYDLKVSWPPAWLQDSARQPDVAVPIQELDPKFLNAFLRPEFVAEDGSVVLPKREDAQYKTFLVWKLQPENSLAERASFLARSVSLEIDDCLIEIARK